MRALMRKEATELGLSFVPILVAICIVWFATLSVENTLIGPHPGRMTAVLLAAAGAGLLFACTQFTGERIRGTWGFLVHRGAGVEGCFRAKASVGAVASVLIGFVPPLALAVVHATILGDSRIVQWSRVVEYASVATVGASSYAITALAFCLRRRPWTEVLLAVIGVADWLMLSVPMTFYVAERLGLFANDPAMLTGFAAVQLAVAVGVLRLAERIFTTWKDPSLSLASSHHAAGLGLGLFLWVPIQLFLLVQVQNGFGLSFLARAPVILRDRVKGDFLLAVPNPSGSYSALRDGQLVQDERLVKLRGLDLYSVLLKDRNESDLDVVYDPRRPSFGPREKLDAAYRAVLFSEWSWQGELRGDWDHSYFDSREVGYWTSLWLDRGAGCLRLFAIRYRGLASTVETNTPTSPPPELPFERIIEKPDGRFSKSAAVLNAVLLRTAETRHGEIDYRVIANERESRPKCIVDPEDQSLWSFDQGFSSSLRKLVLPNNDRVVGIGAVFYRREPLKLGNYQPWFHTCIRGEKGYYEWNGSELVDIDLTSPRSEGVPSEIADSLVEIQAVRTDPDPLFPVVEVRDARKGAVLFTHRYAPMNPEDETYAGLLCLGAILRPPVLDAFSYFRSTSEPSLFSNVFEALLANRSRAWLLALCFLLSLGLAWIAARRARERGASSLVVRLTAVLVAAMGVMGFVMVWMLESRKSRRREARVEPRAEPIVLIETARAT